MNILENGKFCRYEIVVTDRDTKLSKLVSITHKMIKLTAKESKVSIIGNAILNAMESIEEAKK